MKTLFTTTAAAALIAGAGLAQTFADKVVADLQDNGYTYVEIKQGPTQLKAEGIRGTEKIEVIYDITTGEILKQEVETAEADEIGLSGVEFDRRNRDFLDDERDELDDDDDDDDDDDEEDDDEDERDDDKDEKDDDDDDDEDDDDRGDDGGDDGKDDEKDDEEDDD